MKICFIYISWAGFGGYRLNFKEDSIRWVGAIGRLSMNLDQFSQQFYSKINSEQQISLYSYGYYKNKVSSNRDFNIDPEVGEKGQKFSI